MERLPEKQSGRRRNIGHAAFLPQVHHFLRFHLQHRGMSRILLSLLLLIFAGCASPSPDMSGALRRQVTLEGVTFVVFHRDYQAEVVRMGYLSRRDRDRVPGLMQRAAAQTTGCAVIEGSMSTRIPGDTGVARFHMRC